MNMPDPDMARENTINKLMIKRGFWCGVGFLIFGLLPLAWVALMVLTGQ